MQALSLVASFLLAFVPFLPAESRNPISASAAAQVQLPLLHNPFLLPLALFRWNAQCSFFSYCAALVRVFQEEQILFTLSCCAT